MTAKSAALERLATIPRLSLASAATPVDDLSRLRDALGWQAPTLLVKRDDAIPFGFGGNKIRKLQIVAAQALADGADTLITTGGIQSNHARATASVAARLGLGCVLVANGTPPERPTANALLDRLLGADVRYVGSREARAPAMEAAAEELQAQGTPPVRHSARRVHAAGRRGLRAGGDGAAGADPGAGSDRAVDLVGRHAGGPHRRVPPPRAVDPDRRDQRRRSVGRDRRRESGGSWTVSRRCSACRAAR